MTPRTAIDPQLCAEGAPDAATFEQGHAERKLDGVRATSRDGRLYGRRGDDLTHKFPEIAPELPETATLDGELVTRDFKFPSILRRVQTEKPFKIDLLSESTPAVFVAFDILRTRDGEVIRERPQTERSAALDKELAGYRWKDQVIPITRHDDPATLWERATANEWEGIIVKDPDAPYVEGKRSDAWLKVKNWKEGVYPIHSFETTDNDGFVIYVDAGHDRPQKVAVGGASDQATVRAGADRATIQYLERTDAGRLRKPSFKGVPAE